MAKQMKEDREIVTRYGVDLSRPKDRVGMPRAVLTARGREIVDSRPIAPVVRRGPSMEDHMRQLIRSEQLAREAHAEGFESFDEADDFEVGDDYDPNSQYEEVFEGDLVEDMAKRLAPPNLTREPRQEASSTKGSGRLQRPQKPLERPPGSTITRRRPEEAQLSEEAMESLVRRIISNLTQSNE